MSDREYRGGLTKRIYAFLTTTEMATSEEIANAVDTPKSNVVTVLTYMKKNGRVTHPKRGHWCQVENVVWPKRGRVSGMGPDSQTLRTDIVNLLTRKPNLKLNEIVNELPGRRAQSVATIVSCLKREGTIATDGTTRTYTYHLVGNKATVAA